MSAFTVTITPDDTTQPTTTLRLELSATSSRVTELVVRADKGQAIVGGQLPTIDLNELLRAVTAAVIPAEQGASTPAPPARRPARRATTTSNEASPARRGRATAAGASRARAARAAETAEASGTSRAYRKAPADLADVYRQAGTVSGIADHYNVPRHTAASWVRTLRRKTAS